MPGFGNAKHGFRCGPHLRGVDPSVPTNAWFDSRCVRCQDKKARGIVTGNEPPPPIGGFHRVKARVAFGRFMP